MPRRSQTDSRGPSRGPAVRRSRRAVTLLLAAVWVTGCGRSRDALDSPTPSVPAPAPPRVSTPGESIAPFTLTDQTGSPFESKSLDGKVWIGSVFFANCPGPCFRENQALADILREIDSPDLVAVSLTCDPDNDTPEVLRRYADRFEADPARWKFLTGDMAVIKEVANDGFQLVAEVGVHAERGVVFDRRGRLRGGYHLLQPDKVELLKKLVREVLDEELVDAPTEAAPGDTAEKTDRP